MAGASTRTRAERGHRERLLEAGVTCLHERGYAHTTARDLVAESGTNLASIGYHFGSKERLLNEAMRLSLQRWLEVLGTSALASVPTGRAAEWFDEVRAAVRTNRGFVIAFFEAVVQAERAPELRADLAETYEELRRGLAELLSSMLPSDDPRDEADGQLLASIVLALSDGLLLQWLLDPDRLPTGQQLVDVVEAAARRIA